MVCVSQRRLISVNIEFRLLFTNNDVLINVLVFNIKALTIKLSRLYVQSTVLKYHHKSVIDKSLSAYVRQCLNAFVPHVRSSRLIVIASSLKKMTA